MINFNVDVSQASGTSTSIDNISVPPNQIEWMSREWIHVPVGSDTDIRIEAPAELIDGKRVRFGWDEQGPWSSEIDLHFDANTPTVAFWMRADLAAEFTEGPVTLSAEIL